MKKGQQDENSIQAKDIIECHKGARASQIAQEIEGIGNVNYLGADQLVAISLRLFKLVRFCDCVRIKSVERKNRRIDETAHHKCDKFNHHDYQHMPYCRCCQTRGFGYFLAWCLDRLAQEGRLPEYYRASLSVARIRDRTYGYIKCKSKVRFRIWRHFNAWRDDPIFPMELVLQKWTFDLDNLTFTED
jgi:hypothetical protein